MVAYLQCYFAYGQISSDSWSADEMALETGTPLQKIKIIDFPTPKIVEAEELLMKNVIIVSGAFLMATYINGMNKSETISLTKEMTTQGETLQWPIHWTELMVDKHSTGGVGDKTSLLIAPALAVCGLKVSVPRRRSLVVICYSNTSNCNAMVPAGADDIRQRTRLHRRYPRQTRVHTGIQGSFLGGRNSRMSGQGWLLHSRPDIHTYPGWSADVFL